MVKEVCHSRDLVTGNSALGKLEGQKNKSVIWAHAFIG